jgi:serine/threonine protein kinase
MAETFEAARIGDGGFEQRVCLKRVLPAFGEDEDFLTRFRREARLAAQLRHTHVVGVIDAGEVDGVHYIALELVDGVDLRSLLRASPGGKLEPHTVALIAMDLAYALEHAHGRLVHRDISPSNILLSRSGEAKLADFGIAKAMENAKVTASRTSQGKIPYMAPEQMRGESLDGRADLFSLGVVLFEALAGVRPFDGAHDVETMQRVLDGNRLCLEELAPDTPAALQGVVDRLLVIDRESRTESASRLLDELDEAAPPASIRRAMAARIDGLRGGPASRLHVQEREERDTELNRLPPTRGRATSERGPRSRWLPWMAAGLFASLLLGLVWFREAPGSEPLAPLALTPVVETEGSTEPEAIDLRTVPPPPAEPPTRTEPNEGSVDESSPTPLGFSEPEAGTGSETQSALPPPPPTRGWLRIVVEPWGNVWIDGRYFGRAPVKARLPKGRHVIEAGREIPSQRRVVRVQPGARKEVELKLGAQ